MNLILDEMDKKRLEKCKEFFDVKSTSIVISLCINQVYMMIKEAERNDKKA